MSGRGDALEYAAARPISWPTPMRFPVRCLVWVAILGPPSFLLVAIQHGALTHPFSDYCKLIPLVEKLQNGTLAFSDLFDPLNQNRPATWRALVLANAWLTGWDIRSEYLYLVAALVGAFLVQVQLLVRAGAACSRDRVLVLVAGLSIVSFSPAAHNDHWWSMLLQFDLGHLFIVIAFALLSWNGRLFRDHALAALACWLATYTVTNGLVAFLVCAIVAQIFSPIPRRFTGVSLFWTANIALALILYVPGLPDLDRELPSLGQLIVFTFAYIGSPAAAILRFPFQSQFDLPNGAVVTGMNAVAGLGITALLTAKGLDVVRGRDRSCAARAFAAFALFALGSAVLTALGRANFDEAGVANANASRFVLFGSSALFAGLYAGAMAPSRWRFHVPLNPRVVPTAAGLILFACASVSYARSWKVYAEARRFDRLLAAAYADGPDGGPLHALIYPESKLVPGFKATLKRLRMGPYRDAPQIDALVRLARLELIDQFGVNGLRAGTDGFILFAHPHARFAIHTTRAAAIHFRYGVMPNAETASPPTDGVEFRVLASDLDSERLLWSTIWRPDLREPHEQQLTVALPRNFSGTLIFETLAAGTSESDWAYWADLAITGDY